MIGKENTMESHDLYQKTMLNVEWHKSQENAVIKALQAGEDIQEVLESLPGFNQAFDHKLNCLDCSDGRVCTGAKMGLAGAGILLSPEEREILAAAVKERGLVVSGHENCGAAAMAFPGPDSDKQGYAKAKELATASGSEYKEVHKKEFRSAVHNERSLVIDATGRFDCANWPEFPGQFISSAPALGLPDSYLKKEILALTGIALGSHGFGTRFDKENPFYLIVSAQDQGQLDHLTDLAGEVAAGFGDWVEVKGFIAPEQEE